MHVTALQSNIGLKEVIGNIQDELQ